MLGEWMWRANLPWCDVEGLGSISRVPLMRDFVQIAENCRDECGDSAHCERHSDPEMPDDRCDNHGGQCSSALFFPQRVGRTVWCRPSVWWSPKGDLNP